MPGYLVTFSRHSTGPRLKGHDIGLPYDVVSEFNHGIAEDGWEGSAAGVTSIVSAMGRPAGKDRASFDVVLLVEARDEAAARSHPVPEQLLREVGDAMTDQRHVPQGGWTLTDAALAPSDVEIPVPVAPAP